MAVGDVLHLGIAVEGVQHTDDGMSAQTKDVLHIPARQIIDDEIRYQFFAHKLFPPVFIFGFSIETAHDPLFPSRLERAGKKFGFDPVFLD